MTIRPRVIVRLADRLYQLEMVIQVAFGYLSPRDKVVREGKVGLPRSYETDPFPRQLSSTLLLTKGAFFWTYSSNSYSGLGITEYTEF